MRAACETPLELHSYAKSQLFREAKDKQVEAIKAEMSSEGAGRKKCL